jgi:DNA-directed RNA polymerase subunit beta'
MIGAEAVREMLAAMDLERDRGRAARGDCRDVGTEAKKLAKRLKIVESFIESGNRPEWMIMTVLPVIPPDLRPLVPLDGGRFATSDLNDLYRRVINRNNRLKRLIELRAPDIIIRNEKRMLQEAVDALFDNGRRGRVITGANKRPLKSLSDMLKGKQGRFRQNLLGKRVDYSGRSVIVTARTQAAPVRPAQEDGARAVQAVHLRALEPRAMASTVKQAKKLVEKEKPEVWDILDEVIREHPVLLNRAPTLHRLGIQAFEPVLIEGKAIQLHPLVCTAFNADFDGDQMAVHVPLSLEAQLEARVLMMSTNNILHPANGAADHRAVAGHGAGSLLSLDPGRERAGQGMVFSDMGELAPCARKQGRHAAHQDQGPLQDVDEDGNPVSKIYETTPGRMIIGELLPRNVNVLRHVQPGDDQEEHLQDDRHRLPPLRPEGDGDLLRPHHGLGFGHACRAGISFGKDDMVIPDTKAKIVETDELVKEYEQQYNDGLITQGEKYNKVVDAWAKCTDKVADEMMARIKSVQFHERRPPEADELDLHDGHSGARGSPSQMKQLGGMRGLMAKPSGEIIETPIISNFKEGLTVNLSTSTRPTAPVRAWPTPR